jgi:beta-glucosidase
VVSGAGPGITAFPAQIGLAATWNPALAREKGAAYAWEAFYKQRNVVLAPGLASGRTPLSGRNNEYFGEDPLLSGLMAAANIRGIQDDTPPDVAVQALKHYLANEQGSPAVLSSNIDERTLSGYVLPWGSSGWRPWHVLFQPGEQGLGLRKRVHQNTILNGILASGLDYLDFGSVHSTAQTLIGGLDQELSFLVSCHRQSERAALAAADHETEIDAAAFSGHVPYQAWPVRRHASHSLVA